MRPIHFLRGAAFSLSVLLTASACGTFTGSGGSGGSSGQSLAITLQFTPKAGFALETDDAFVLSQAGCMETLVSYDLKAGKLQPVLATKWAQTSPTTWDFTLRTGVKFQDGTDFDADAVAFSLGRLLKATTPPRAFTPKVISAVEAVDKSTVRVTTPAPSVLTPYRLASVNTGILAKAAYLDRGMDVVKRCTGPFTITSATLPQSLTVQRNDGYWGDKAALAKAEVKFLPDGNARATQIRTGEAGIAIALPSSAAQQLRGDKQVVLSEVAEPRTTGLYLNNSKAPFDNPDVRKAVQLAVDVPSIAGKIYSGSAEPASGPFTANEPWAPKGVGPAARNVEQAKALLSRAGYREGQLSVSLRGYTERPEFADLAAVVQDQLKQIGITVKVTMSDYAGLEPSLLGGNYDMALLARNHLADVADPIGFLEADYTCKGGFNISRYCDADFDKRLAQANAETDAGARYAVYADLAKRLQDQAVTVFLVSSKLIAATRPGVQNFVNDPLARYALTPQVTLAN